jgi:hypothetical protein
MALMFQRNKLQFGLYEFEILLKRCLDCKAIEQKLIISYRFKYIWANFQIQNSNNLLFLLQN